MSWRVAHSLDKLLDQLNDLYPSRSKISDGSIGDAEHASRDSDHNPWYLGHVVTARDFTHDPDGGIDCHKLAAWLTSSRDHRIKYVIWDGRIWFPGSGWEPYYGPNPHDYHLHLSVVASPACDNATAWKLGAAGQEGDVMTPAQEKKINDKLDYLRRVGVENQSRVNQANAALAALARLVAAGTNDLTEEQVRAAIRAELADAVVDVDVNVRGNVAA